VLRGAGRFGHAATGGDTALVARARTTADGICRRGVGRCGLGLNVPLPVRGRFREMPCGGFAQEFGGDGITH
jgi:hypothetical protein